jgi:hypothetical protein
MPEVCREAAEKVKWDESGRSWVKESSEGLGPVATNTTSAFLHWLDAI